MPAKWADNEMAGPDWLSRFLKRHGDIPWEDQKPHQLGERSASTNTLLAGFFWQPPVCLWQREVYTWQNLEPRWTWLCNSGFPGGHFSGRRVPPPKKKAKIFFERGSLHLHFPLLLKQHNPPPQKKNPPGNPATVQWPERIIATTGVKQVGAMTFGERGQLVTLCCAVSATGNAVPTMFIFPESQLQATLYQWWSFRCHWNCSQVWLDDCRQYSEVHAALCCPCPMFTWNQGSPSAWQSRVSSIHSSTGLCQSEWCSDVVLSTTLFAQTAASG